MLQLKKVLVPTDFEIAARNAYAHAESLVKEFGGDVDILHVIPTLKYFHESLKTVGYPIDMEEDLYPKLTEKAKEKVMEDMKTYISEEYRGQELVKIAPKASEVIMETAEKNKCDVIVMGAHNNEPMEMILGTITDRVIRRSNIPVLSVPPDVEAERINNIVVPTDFSDRSLRGIKSAVRFAMALEAKITILHVLELYGSSGDRQKGEISREEASEVRKRMFEKIQNILQKMDDCDCQISSDSSGDVLIFSENGKDTTIPFNLEVTRGVSAHYEIVDYANNNADMVVITTHGRSGLAHFLLGSTTEKVVRWSTKPVFVTRTSKKDLQ